MGFHWPTASCIGFGVFRLRVWAEIGWGFSELLPSWNPDEEESARLDVFNWDPDFAMLVLRRNGPRVEDCRISVVVHVPSALVMASPNTYGEGLDEAAEIQA